MPAATARSLPDDVVRERLRAQRLGYRSATTPDAVTRHLLAIQAQDPRGFRLAVRARSTGLLAADVDRALDERRLVVAWLNRGTLHLVTATDYWWLQPLTTPQLRTANTTRLRQEAVSPEQAVRGVAVVSDVLTSRGPTSRAALREILADAGVPTAGQALVHVLYAAALDGLLVRGPVLPNGEQAFVDPVGWLGPPPDPLPEEEALALLALRYLAGHGPATADDLAYWAGIRLGAARRAVAAAGLAPDDDGLVRCPSDEAAGTNRAGDCLTADGTDDGTDDGTGDGAHGRPANGGGEGEVPPRLLGPFDPALHGWRSREPLLGPHTRIVTSNGIFKASLLDGRRVVGTWTVPGGRVTLAPLEPVRDDVLRALMEDARDVQRYLALPDRAPEVLASPGPATADTVPP